MHPRAQVLGVEGRADGVRGGPGHRAGDRIRGRRCAPSCLARSGDGHRVSLPSCSWMLLAGPAGSAWSSSAGPRPDAGSVFETRWAGARRHLAARGVPPSGWEEAGPEVVRVPDGGLDGDMSPYPFGMATADSTLRSRLDAGRSFSFEFFPPRDDAG